MTVLFSGLRRAVLFGMAALAILLGPMRSAQGETPLPPLRMPSQAIGSRCFGLLPCTTIDPFGIRLRAAVLAIFRPEKGRDRQLYAARIQIAPSVTLMQWAEIGVAMPITLYTKDIGVTPIYEPLQPFARVRLPLDTLLGGLATTAFVRVHIAQGPFVGGLPPSPADNTAPPPMPDFMAQAMQNYQAQTQFEVGLAAQKRIGPLTATAAIGTSVAAQRIEIYGGAELGYKWKLLHAFAQGMGIGVPKCPPDEAALNFCARGFRFTAGVRFDFDIGGGGLLVGTGSGAVEPGWMVGAQVGLDYDETVRRMHGDGTEAAHEWWDRRFEAMARGWAAWKSAAVAWDDEDEAARRAQPPRRGPFSELLPGGEPPPSSPWLDGLLGDDAPAPPPLSLDPQAGAPPLSPGVKVSAPQAQRGRPAPGRKPPRRSLFAEANARAALQRQLAQPPGFKVPSSLDLMTDAELARLQWQVIQEELRRKEQQKWQEASPLPPMEKAVLNFLATLPYEAALSVLELSGPGAAAEVEDMRQKLRPLKYTPAEREAGAAMEGAYRSMLMALGPAAAEQAMARQAMLAMAREEARNAGQVAAFAAAERPLLGAGAQESAAAPSGPRFASLLDRLPPRLNPMNYELCGIGCPGGDLRFRGARAATAVTEAGSSGASEAEAVHLSPPEQMEAPVSMGGGEAETIESELVTDSRSRASFERYKEEQLIPKMGKPFVEDPELEEIVSYDYRANAKHGNGSTAHAASRERQTGLQTEGRWHAKKARELLVSYQKWLRNHQNARPGDLAAAENLIRQLELALGE